MSTYPKFSVRDDQKNAHINASSIAVSGNLSVAGSMSAKNKVFAATTALSVTDSGAVLIPTGTAQTFTLPAVATAAGVTFTFMAGSAANHVIDGGGAKIQGHTFDSSNDGSTFADTAISNKTSITLANGAVGDLLVINGDGTNYYVSGILNDTPTLA